MRATCASMTSLLPHALSNISLGWAGLFVGAVVVEDPFGMLNGQRRELSDLGGPGLGVGERADAVCHPGLQRGFGRQLLGGDQHAAGPPVADQ